MPSLACWICGRRIYMSDSIDVLLPDERRCPRCGADMDIERRDYDRRQTVRRQNAPDRPGPPGRGERRASDRRSGKDRRIRR
jgi:ssDNA-binding Zn-finger/Zn-ribbon topoisomerase 1